MPGILVGIVPADTRIGLYVSRAYFELALCGELYILKAHNPSTDHLLLGTISYYH